MKINEMNRAELKDYMERTGEIKRPDKESRAWQRAFDLAVASGMGNLDRGCNSCWDKVIAWIKR